MISQTFALDPKETHASTQSCSENEILTVGTYHRSYTFYTYINNAAHTRTTGFVYAANQRRVSLSRMNSL